MTVEHSMTHVIMQALIEADKAAIMPISEVDNTVSNARPVHAMPRSVSPTLNEHTFDWRVAEKYQELCNFETEVKRTFFLVATKQRKPRR